ncbi:thioredoxin family protein [Heyndrickxia camelliae]|uniref:Thiol reductase thioredoxin n=1 Tax=Heyndrickxia camelliae TaxID=1707093 RepID=A0A2N3LGA7_9BACI|nr:thioredoxin family protein [Heyndrickxia camelliae]PKR83553.1 thiol reductase thioredoxin [Heyndrickxia camelliae]
MKLLKLYQPSCTPCQFVENFLQDQGVEYESINVQEEPDIAFQFGVMSTPVTILVDDEGKEVQRVVGFKPDEIEEVINKL